MCTFGGNRRAACRGMASVSAGQSDLLTNFTEDMHRDATGAGSIRSPAAIPCVWLLL